MAKTIPEYVMEAKKGSQEAFAALFEMTSKKAYYTAFKITKNQQDAEDMVQDAYLKAFSSLDTLTDNRKFESWLNMIVANKCRDYLRKKKPELFSKYENEDSDTAFEDSLENSDLTLLPHEVTDNKATRKLIMECIDKLPDEQRLCVVMFYYNELSVKDIAASLNIPTGTVKSRLNKARKTLKASFEAMEERDNIKLHSVPFAPLLLWVFRRGAEADNLPKLTYRKMLKSIIEALRQSGKILAGMKVTGGAVLMKIIAVLLVGAVAVAGVGYGINALLDKNDDTQNGETTTAVSTVTEEADDDAATREPYYAEGALAVKDRNGSIYYITDGGIRTADGTRISEKVPANLVYEDSLLYLDGGTLYRYDNGQETAVMPASGAALYRTSLGYVSITADKTAAYALDLTAQKSEKLPVNGSHMRLIDDNFYYYDSSSNLCRCRADGSEAKIITPADSHGFQAGWAVDGSTTYFADFDSDVNGVIYNGSGSISLSSEGVRDFTVVNGTIYYSTCKGKFFKSTPGGSSTLIAEKDCNHLVDADGYTLWAEMDSGNIFIIKAGETARHYIDLPNPVTDVSVLGNTVYYRAGSSHGTASFGSDSNG